MTDDLLDRVEHHHAQNGDVSLHYVRVGDGDPVLFLHGFPDYWYTWRHQMEALESDFEVMAMDLRGYNLSDQPAGVPNYTMTHLLGDVRAVLEAAGHDSATIVGHDWGAGIAWQFAMAHPEMVDRLVILSVPHPSGFGRELATNEAQQRDSQYARDFQKPGAHESLTAEGLAGWVRDEQARAHYVEAFRRSSFEAMLNYYKASYPRVGGSSSTDDFVDRPRRRRRAGRRSSARCWSSTASRTARCTPPATAAPGTGCSRTRRS